MTDVVFKMLEQSGQKRVATLNIGLFGELVVWAKFADGSRVYSIWANEQVPKLKFDWTGPDEDLRRVEKMIFFSQQIAPIDKIGAWNRICGHLTAVDVIQILRLYGISWNEIKALELTGSNL